MHALQYWKATLSNWNPFYFPYWFFILVVLSVAAYILDTYFVTEWRARYFKDMNDKDNGYVQKATDALLNFETALFRIAGATVATETGEACRVRAIRSGVVMISCCALSYKILL